MDSKDNARYWVEYNNLKERAEILFDEWRSNLKLKINKGEIDENTFADLWHLTWELYDKDPKVLEFKKRFSVYNNLKEWQKILKRFGCWREVYIKGPNEDMECLACGEPLKSPRHDTLDCSTSIIYKRYIYRIDYNKKDYY